MRALLLDGPAWILDQIAIVDMWLARGFGVVWQAYWLLIAAASILCFTMAALWVVLNLLGMPVPLPPPGPRPVAPAAGRTGALVRLSAPRPRPPA